MSETGRTVVRIEDGPDAGAVWHYGDPFGEQRALAAGAGVIDQSHRPVIRIAGPDRLTWLHSLTSQHLTGLLPGEWTQALILSPHGHVEHHLTLIDDGAQVLAHVEPGTDSALLDYLTSMIFWSEVEVSLASDQWAVLELSGGYVLIPRFEVPLRMAELGPPAGMWAADALRVAAGRPRLGFETDHKTIPAEVGWIGSAVHLDKGCYRGQETVARVHNLGRPPRRLVLLHLDGSQAQLPLHGDPVGPLDGRPVGFVGTAARHYELGPIALALVKRSVVAGDPLFAGEGDRLVSATPTDPEAVPV
jgi:tRNA-modifying protein YgfZ